MSILPKIFFRWPATILFILIPPIFFLVFSLVYDPFDLVDFLNMGEDLYALNISIVFAIIFVLLTITRISLHFLKKVVGYSWGHYFSWCIVEMVLISLFTALFVSLMSLGAYPYFDALFRYCLPHTFLILIYPYAILTLAFALAGSKEEAESAPQADESLIRFFDVYKKLKLVIGPSAILYIKAEENYMSIWYTDNGKAVKYSLRAPMTSIEESCVRHGLVRCQRSYFINPSHVTILRKENGWIYADLDMDGLPSIPVSKRYYDTISSLL